MISNKLNREYHRFQTTNKILNLMCENGCDKKEKYELKNIFERWLLSSSNLCAYENDTFDKVYSVELVKNIDHVINQKMISELVEKRITIKPLAIKLTQKILQEINSYLTSSSDNKTYPINIKESSQLITIKYRDFQRNISKKRFDILMKKGGIENIMISALRYASIISSSQHWNIPLENYKRYVKDYQVSVEGFSSPFNSQLLLLVDDAKFCSLFKDTDAIFGSLGNFFEADFQGYSVAVNPPFVIDIINKLYDKCNSECQKAKNNNNKVRFLIIFSAWRDTYAYQSLLKSSFLKYTIEIEPGKHYYVDSNNPNPNGETKKIRTSFTTVLFVLSQGFNDKSDDYINALNEMKI